MLGEASPLNLKWYSTYTLLKSKGHSLRCHGIRGSHIPTEHEQQCCRFQNYAKSHAIAYEIYKRNLQSVNQIPGIHENGPRDHEL